MKKALTKKEKMPDSLGGVPDTTFERSIQKNNNQHK